VDALGSEVDEMEKDDPFEKSAGDYMAAAIDIMVHYRQIDARSLAADARLCWGDPWTLDVARRVFESAGNWTPKS